MLCFFFFSSRRRHTRLQGDWSSDVCSSDLYGGSAESNLVLQTIQPLTMPLRRHMCVGLVGDQFRTFDNLMAFAKSVNFVVADRELSKIRGIVRQAVAENDQFYRVFRESLRDAGKM